MASQATEIRDFIEANWALTGRLSKTQSGNMKEVVRFFDRWEVEGNEWPKAIVVEKINDEEDENVTVHPNFSEVSDIYQIRVRYRVWDVQEISFSDALTDVEDMAREVQRILKILFDPSTGTGTFFVARHRWTKFDHKDQAQPELIRELTFELTQIRSENDEVFRGYNGVIVFDVSNSEGDNLPISDYSYTELRGVTMNEGYSQIDYLTKDQTKGVGVPIVRRGLFRGVFSALLNINRDDVVDAGTTNLISEIYKVQSNSPIIDQVAEIAFLHNLEDTESVVRTFTTTSFMKIDNVEKVAEDEALATYRLTGHLTRPSLYAITPP